MSDKNQQDFLGKKILQNCRNELYLDFPYLDGGGLEIRESICFLLFLY